MTFETLALRQDGAILTVTLRNPPNNLMTAAMVGELFQLTGRLIEDREVRVVILDSADPDFFIAHFDLNDVIAAENDPSRRSRYPDINVLQSLALAWQNLPQVKIAKIDGRCRGGGLEFILALDMRFASERSLFCMPEVAAGFLPSGGGTTRVALAAGPSRALEIVLSARDFSGQEAERYGLINRCLPDDELDAYVDVLAARIALRAQPVVAGVREVHKQVFAGIVEPLFKALAAENDALHVSMQGEEMPAIIQMHLKAGQTRDVELDLPATMDGFIATRNSVG